MQLLTNNNRKGKTIKATLWSMLERFATIGIQLVCTLVMAQFLTPAEFGLISMVSIFMAFSNIIIDAGFSQALIREQNVTKEDYSSVFFFNIIVGSFLYLVFFASAPLIASFYNEPKLTLVVRVSFISLIVFSTTAVQQARLYKNVDFANVSKVSLISVTISGAVGIIVAWYSRSVWAIVLQSLTFSICRSVLLWSIGNWYPQLVIKWGCIKKYIGFSLNLLMTNIIAAITDNLPNLFIGKSYSASVLGGYTIPDKLQRSISGTLSFSIHRVSYPIMAQFQDDTAQLRNYSQKVVNMAFFIISPIMMFLMIEAQDLFDILLPSEWSDSAYYFKYLCIIGAIFCFADINLDVLMVRGMTQLILCIEIIRKSIFLAILFIGIKYSIDTFLTLLIIYNLFNALFVSYFYGKSINCSLCTQLKNIFKTILNLSIVTFITNLYVTIDMVIFLRFVSSAIIFVVLYLLIALALKDASFEFILSEARKRIKVISK